MTLLRLERRTYCLEGSCSIQLSYGAIGSFTVFSSFHASLMSGHPDSNWGSPAPKAGAITGLRYAPGTKKTPFGASLGGEGGIRTPGTLIEYDSLANCWFQPLTHLSVVNVEYLCFACETVISFLIEIGCKSTNFLQPDKIFFLFI